MRKLRQKGEITETEEQIALAHLQLRLKEKPWPHQPEITDRAILYLDDLAVYYFLHLGLLEKLCVAGFRAIVSPHTVSEINDLISYERNTDKVNSAIEKTRSAVSLGIESGQIRVGKWRNVDASWTEKSDIQMAGILALAQDCDAVITDDRFLNRHGQISHNDVQTPLFTTLDLLDALVVAGSITAEDRLEYRTKLRRAGFFFVPLCEDELIQHLTSATVTEGKLNETTELKAIRENILLVRMSDWLQLPKEDVWLDTIFKVFVNVLRSLWRIGADISSIEARSNWILDQVDVRGWLHCIGPESRDDIAQTGQAKIIFMLLTPLVADVPLNIREAYWGWVEDKVLAPITELYPDLYALIINLERRHISELADTDLTDEERYGE